MNTTPLPSPPRSGILGTAAVGAFAGLCIIALILGAFVAYAASNSPALGQAGGFGVVMGLNSIAVVMSIGWVFALPCALLLTGAMIVGERVSPRFAMLAVWLLASLAATSPLALFVHWLDGMQRLDRPGVLHIVYGAGLIGAAAAWYWRHRRRGAAA